MGGFQRVWYQPRQELARNQNLNQFSIHGQHEKVKPRQLEAMKAKFLETQHSTQQNLLCEILEEL
jgi:hypothetical protein